MAKRHQGTTNKKTFSVSDNEYDLVVGYRHAAGKPSNSAVLAEIIHGYVAYGTDYKPPVMVELQTIVDPAILMEAEEKARAEGTNLRDVVRFEIRELEKL